MMWCMAKERGPATLCATDDGYCEDNVAMKAQSVYEAFRVGIGTPLAKAKVTQDSHAICLSTSVDSCISCMIRRRICLNVYMREKDEVDSSCFVLSVSNMF